MMAEMVTIVHNDYDRISDTVFWLNKDWVVKFVVRLNRYTENRGKENYHKEFGYSAKNGFAVSINRDFDYFLQIESVRKDNNGFKDQIQITQNDIYFLQFKLNKASKWFTGAKSIFAKSSNGAMVPTKTYSEKIDISFGKYIEIEPAVVKYDNGNYITGVRFYMNSDAVNFFIDVNKFLSFNYFISNFNMYLAAQGLLSYLGRPENGTNYVSFNSLPKNGNRNNYNNSNNSSFFSKVNATER